VPLFVDGYGVEKVFVQVINVFKNTTLKIGRHRNIVPEADVR